MLFAKSLLKSSEPKTQKIAATPRSLDSTIDVKRLVPALVLITIVAALAIWAITVTFSPGTVTRLERYTGDEGPAPPSKPADARRTPPATAQKAEAIPRQAEVIALQANGPRASSADSPTRPQGPAREPGSVIPLAPVAKAAPPGAKLPPPELRFETFEEVADAAVYSARDRDVEPPLAIYPQELGRMPIGVRPEDLAYVEVVVNEDGSVAAVKARNSPRTLDEAMILTMSLSAAKTWRFQPARKEGRPVRYRQVIPVSIH